MFMFAWVKRLVGGSGPPGRRGSTRDARSADPEIRMQTAERLGGVFERWAGEVLAALLGDGHPAVREAALDSLRRQGDAALRPLLGALNHADPEVGKAAADLLGRLHSAEAVGPLLSALKYAARPVQTAARRALEALGGLAVPALEAARDDPQPWVRRQVEEILVQARSLPNAAGPPG
jgi:HEAT repeat protein